MLLLAECLEKPTRKTKRKSAYKPNKIIRAAEKLLLRLDTVAVAAEGNFEESFYQIGPIGLLKTEGGCSYKTSRRQPCCREPATEKALLTNTPGIHAPDRADYAAQAQTQALKPAPPPCNFGSDRQRDEVGLVYA